LKSGKTITHWSIPVRDRKGRSGVKIRVIFDESLESLIKR